MSGGHQHLASPVSMLLLWNLVIHNRLPLVSALYRDSGGCTSSLGVIGKIMLFKATVKLITLKNALSCPEI